MARIIIAGGGVGGLGTALYLARTGHEVVIAERDDTPLPPSAADAFWWDRRGAPQVRHSHAFLARLHNQLRDDHPDVLDELLSAGATEMDFIGMLPEGMDRTPMPGDEDLVALACRRTTFEWVMRHAVCDTGAVDLRPGTAVVGLRTDHGSVTGVELSDGSSERGDLVVLAGGRRMDLPALYHACGAELVESTHETGIIYLSRFYQLVRGAVLPPQLGPIGGDLGYLKYAVFEGDAGTFSVTLAIGSRDHDLRRLLTDPGCFDEAARLLPATSSHLDGRAEPITGVELMGGLINRRREFTRAGEPVLPGVVAVGDAHTATNPIYGRGCSLAMVQAKLLCDALERSPDDPRATGAAYEQHSDAEIVPWYRAAVAQDRLNTAGDNTPDTDGDSTLDTDVVTEPQVTRAQLIRDLLRDGLAPAVRVDPVVLRAFLAMFNLLRPPDSLLTDSEVVNRVMAVYADRDNRPAEPPLGPVRQAFLTRLAAHVADR